ncbi:hypothetical protein [Sulfurimonas sp.]|uniref:hypothetical protein n=1 Tax=Sulfurimonas sp. TaxID=2022749 RepID=UPI003567EF3B
MRLVIFTFLGLFILLSTQSFASIVNTRHNLSVSNNVVPVDANDTIIKAQVETEVCVFCHVPHFSQPVGKPLWNRSMPTSQYTMYDSDYLRRMNYPAVATDLGSANNTPGALSRQCLSCHDGTIAVGAVSKLRGTSDALIAMDGVAADGTIPSTATFGFFGTDLTNHHPVGIEYDATPTVSFGDGGVRGMELKAIPDAPIKLYEYSGYSGKYVECSSCHDPHVEGSTTESNKFLHVDSEATHAGNFVATCTSCHQKDGWDLGVHKTPPGSPNYSDPAVLAKYGTSSVAEMGCANCHTPHNAEGVPYINRKQLGNTCFQGAASTVEGGACHGVGGAKDIQSVLTRTYVHPVVASSTGDSNHTNLDSLYGTGDVDMQGKGGMSWDNNKHAVCMDCHNPHQAQPGTHIVDGSWYGEPGASTNLVSNVLKGVPGVEPTWPTAWTQPTTFTTKKEAEKEYQICFKCHSYWGIGNAINGVNTGGHYSPSEPTQLLTDVAWEMNINNKSGHPVVINQLGRTGSYDPKALDPAQLLSPWKENPGLNTMYCSDCHGADNELGGDPKGPHGSDLKFILKGENQSWPWKPGTTTLYTMDDLVNGTDADLFCKNCHDPQVPHVDWWNKMSNKGYQCVQCHVMVPHGSPVSRLLGYYSFPEPYNLNGNTLQMQGYRKNVGIIDPLDMWADGSLSGSNTCDGATCHRTNDSANGAYDADLITP